MLFKSDSHLTPPKKRFLYFNKRPLKKLKNAFPYILKALFVLKIFQILSWLFGHVEKTDWLERQSEFQNSRRQNLVNKQSQYT